MLYNLPYLSNSELFYLFVSRNKRFIETLNANVTAATLRDLNADLSAIVDEIDKREKAGWRLKD